MAPPFAFMNLAAFCLPGKLPRNLSTFDFMDLEVLTREVTTPRLWVTGQGQSPLGPVWARKCSVTLTMMKPDTPLKMP